MTITAEALLAACNVRRVELGSLRSDQEPLPWSEVASQVGVHAANFSRLRGDQMPGPKTLSRILTWLGMTEADFECGDCSECGDCKELTVTGSTDLPIASTDMEWDGSAATDNVFEAATDGEDVDVDFVEQAFLYRDPDADPATQSAYKLPFADIVDGSLTIVPRGVSAAAGGRGVDATEGISDDEKDSIKDKICTLYGKIQEQDEEWPDCPFAEEEGDEGEEENRSEGDEEESEEGGGSAADKTAAIMGTGRLSDSDDEATQDLVTRTKELLEEGAVGVSIKHDLNPDDMPSQEEIDRLIEEERFEELEELMNEVKARPRHVAIVDTAAFSDARLTLGEDGFSVSGPVAFEGLWTGDLRSLPYGGLVWEDLLPVPITWGHEAPGGGMPPTIGFIDSLERVDDAKTAVRGPETSEKHVEAVVAAASSSPNGSIPASYFKEKRFTQVTPLTVGAPDKRGMRHVYGHAAPRGVCHRSDMGACFQYPGDVDKTLRHFHTGAVVTLDDGTTIRTGALTTSGMHLDTQLARRGVGAREANRHREDSSQVLGMVRAYEDAHGLAVSGVIIPGVDEGKLMQALACSPSVELWPESTGRTLVGINLVPTPAWPVVASAGSAQRMTSPSSVVVEGELETESQAGPEGGTLDLSEVTKSLARIEKVLALLASDRLADVPLPEEE